MTSYLAYKKKMAVLDVVEENIERWITVRGNHIPVMKGQTEAEAVENFTKRKRAEKNIQTHEKAKEHIEKQLETYKNLAEEGQKRFQALYKDYESYRNDPELRNLSEQNNKLYKEMRFLESRLKTHKSYIKHYNDVINQLDNAENKIEDSGVAKVISFGKMPLEKAKEAITNLKALQEKYPFMKGKLDYIGTQDSDEFKKWYRDDIIQWAVNNNYSKIQEHIQNCRDIAKRGKPASESVWDEIRYNNAVKTLEEIEKNGEEAYARMWAESHYRTTKRFTNRVWAYYMQKYDGKSGVIVFNSQNYDTHGQNSGDYHPVGCDTPKSVLDHEYGHSVYYELKLDKSFGNPEGSTLDKLRKFIVVEFGTNSKDYIRKNLSGYAATNLSEFFAEAFSEYQNNPEPRRIAKTIGEYLEEYKKESQKA